MKEEISKKQQILNSLAKTMKELRGEKSQFIFSSENDIPIAIVSMCERALKNPQLTTIFKLAEAYDISPAEFIKKISGNLPENFSMIDK